MDLRLFFPIPIPRQRVAVYLRRRRAAAREHGRRVGRDDRGAHLAVRAYAG
jgi:hypothetical protein